MDEVGSHTDSITMPGTGGEIPAAYTLSELEMLLSNAACVMLDGPSTPAQQRAFRSYLSGYKAALHGDALELLTDEMNSHGDETTSRAKLIAFLFDSKHNIVSSAAFEHSQSSKVEALRHEFEKTRARRVAGKLSMGAAVGSAGYATARGLEAVSDLEGTGIALLTAWGLNKMLRIGTLAQTITGASGRVIRQKGFVGLEKTSVKDMRQTLDSVAHISNKLERKRATYKLLTKIHLEPAEDRLWKVLGPLSLSSDEERELAVQAGVEAVLLSLHDVYSIETEESQGKLPRWRQILGLQQDGA